MASSSALIRRGDLSLRRIDDRHLVLFSGQNEVLRFEKPRKSKPGHRQQATCPHCHQLMPENLADELDSAYFRMLDSLKQTEEPQWQGDEHPMLLGPPEKQASREKPVDDGIAPLSLSQGYFERFFKTKKLLGRGSRAAVYLVEHCLEGVVIGELALKKIPVGNDHAWLEKVLAEVTLLSSISHPNLVRYNHVWLEVSTLSSFCPPLPCAYVLQAYCNGGTLEDLVFKRQNKESEGAPRTKEELLAQRRSRNKERSGHTTQPEPVFLSDDEIYSFMRDILSGLAHLHDQGFLHCDLKPSNCLLQYQTGQSLPSVLVSDFGESQREGSVRGGTGCTGTLEYTAPETLKPNNGKYVPFSRQSDMFSAGMILHFLCFSGLPYSTCWADETDLQRFRQEIQEFEFSYASSIARFGRQARCFEQLLCLLLGSASSRPDAKKALAILEEARNAPKNTSENEPAPLNQPDIYVAKPPRSWFQQYLEEAQLVPHYFLSRALILYLLHPSSIVVQCSIVLLATELKFGPHLLFDGLQLLVLGFGYLK